MRRLPYWLLTLLTVLALGVAAHAAVDSTDILIKALIEKQVITEEEAASVRAEIAVIRQEEEAARTSTNVTSKRPLKISGYLQARVTQSIDDAANAGFEVKRSRLTLAGDPTPVIDYKVQVDFAGSRKAVIAVNAVPANSKTDVFGRPLLLDAAIGYKLTPTDRISAGQFYVPFGLENTTSDAQLDTINRSQATEKLVPGRDTGNQGRDIGIQASGAHPLAGGDAGQLEYAVALLNGSGINVGEDNRRKDLAARLVWKTAVEGLTVGADGYLGATGIVAGIPHQRTGVELVYQRNPWALKSEYFTGKDAVKKHGWYATATRFLIPAAQAVVRYDQVSSTAYKSTDTVKPTSNWTFGINWFLSRDTLTRFAVNYEVKREDDTQVKNDLLLAQFQAGF